MVRTAYEPHELISRREALKILTWVTGAGLYAGSYRTDELTRFPAGKGTLYSRQECEALRDSIIAAGNLAKRRYARRERRQPVITELI